MDYLKLADSFLTNLFSEIEIKKISLNFKEIDHICFRTESETDYQVVCRDFSRLGNLLAQSLVNGRLISTFKLYSPIEFRELKIPMVEVPAPKAGKEVKRGFEHIEMVVSDSFESLVQKYSHLTIDQSGLAKKYNQELEIVLASGAIKFHHQSLEAVIELEKSGMY